MRQPPNGLYIFVHAATGACVLAHDARRRIIFASQECARLWGFEQAQQIQAALSPSCPDEESAHEVVWYYAEAGLDVPRCLKDGWRMFDALPERIAVDVERGGRFFADMKV